MLQASFFTPVKKKGENLRLKNLYGIAPWSVSLWIYSEVKGKRGRAVDFEFKLITNVLLLLRICTNLVCGLFGYLVSGVFWGDFDILYNNSDTPNVPNFKIETLRPTFCGLIG